MPTHFEYCLHEILFCTVWIVDAFGDNNDNCLCSRANSHEITVLWARIPDGGNKYTIIYQCPGEDDL